MVNEPEEKKEDYSPTPVKKTRIYAMPEKFYVSESSGREGKNTFLIVAIIILAVALLGGGAYFLIQKTGQSTNTDTNDSGLSNLKNVNENVNENVNAENSNANANTNIVNINTDTNVNIQTNRNIDVSNINLFTNTNTQPPINTNTTVTGSQDTDKDGLTDMEESLFGTSISLSDTDNDGFSDGQEVVNGYDPNGLSKLENSSKVRTYSDTINNYNLLYPAVWAVADDPQNVDGKIFTSGEEFVSMSVQDNPARLSARDWYLTKSPGINSSQISTVNNWAKTLVGAKSLDNLSVYYTKGDKTYIINYNINILSEAGYESTFEMMYKSFKIGSSGTTSNTNSIINLNTYTSNTNTSTNTNSNTNINSNTNTNINSNTNTNANTNFSNGS